MWDTDRPPPEYFDELRRVSVNQIIWGGNYYFDILGLGGGIVIWDKLNGESLYADGELAWVSRGLQKRLSIFRHQWCGAFKASERGEDKIHPTQKPVALYKWLRKNYAKPGNKILDTHGGSGSSVIACLDMGYEIMWIEKDPDYFQAALKRIKDFAAQPKLPMNDTPEPVEQRLGFEEAL
jgi:site-specific DNA-methyltransferase (adenine-specific)